MADLQKVSQLIAEVAHTLAGKQKASQIIAEVAYTVPVYKELDFMETYTTNALAQAAWVSSNGGPTVLSPTNMTSDTEPAPYVAAASGGTAAYQLWNGNRWYIASYTAWVRMYLGSATECNGYQIKASGWASQAPKDWTYEGSDDGTSWDVLDTITGASFTNNNWNYYSFSPVANYSYYRLNMTLGGDGYLDIQQIKLVYADPPSLAVYSEPSIVAQGLYALKAVATTDAVDQTLTKTLSAPVDLAGYDAVIFRIKTSRTGTNLKLAVHDSGGTWSEQTVNVGQTGWIEKWINLTAVADADKNAIDQIRLTISNADAENTVYLDRIIGVPDYDFPVEPIPQVSSTIQDAAQFSEGNTGVYRSFLIF